MPLTPSSSEEGRDYDRSFWLHLMGELSAKPTEGEKLLDRCTNAVFAAQPYGCKNVA